MMEMVKVINIEQKEECEKMLEREEECLKKLVVNWCRWVMVGGV